MESGSLGAVGVWFYSLDSGRYLYLMRNDARYPQTWALPGGKIKVGETLLCAIRRECQEEMGFMPEVVRLVPIEKFTSADGLFQYHTFFAYVACEFQPCLNHEHHGYAWISSDVWPRAMHPGLWNTANFQVIKDKLDVLRQNLPQITTGLQPHQ